MRSALAQLDGIDEADCVVDYGAKTVTVDVEGTELESDDLVAAFEGTRFTATPN